MKKQNNITYLLGAGASYHSIPIVEKFNNVLFRFTKKIQELSDNNPKQKELSDLMHKCIDVYRYAYKFNTADTYARKLFLQDKKSELYKFKTTISLFLTIWQQMVDKNQLFDVNVAVAGVDINSQKVEDKYVDIDPRYITLLSSLLNRKKDLNKIVIDDNINFISWNYDVQLEMAIGEIIDNNRIDEIIDDYSVYPNINNTQNPSPYRIVHLNGIAGLYETTKDNKIYTLFNRVDKNSSLDTLIKELFFVLENTSRGSISNNRTFSYAWEDDDKSKKAIEEASRIMSQTDVLVIIGYSFPAFNKDIDEAIFSHLGRARKIKNIFYQDPDANVELLVNRFGIHEKLISLEKNVKQFTIPLHYL